MPRYLTHPDEVTAVSAHDVGATGDSAASPALPQQKPGTQLGNSEQLPSVDSIYEQ